MNKEQPKNAFRVTLTLSSPRPRIDQVLLEELRKQSRNLALKNISRTEFKELFKKKRVRIKGQPAVPSSSLAQGTTYVDIIGFEDKTLENDSKKTQSMGKLQKDQTLDAKDDSNEHE